MGDGCRKEVRALKIKKVDDKPMVIHTKEKAKATGAKSRKANVTEAKKSYRKSTLHQAGAKDKGLSRFKQNIRESNIRYGLMKVVISIDKCNFIHYPIR